MLIFNNWVLNKAEAYQIDQRRETRGDGARHLIIAIDFFGD